MVNMVAVWLVWLIEFLDMFEMQVYMRYGSDVAEIWSRYSYDIKIQLNYGQEHGPRKQVCKSLLMDLKKSLLMNMIYHGKYGKDGYSGMLDVLVKMVYMVNHGSSYGKEIKLLTMAPL